MGAEPAKKPASPPKSEELASHIKEKRPEAKPGLVPGLLSIFPGCVVHSLGAWAAEDKETATSLLATEGAGLASMGLGAILLFSWGGADELSRVTLPLLVGGAGSFLSSWLAGCYAAWGGAELAGSPRLQLPSMVIEFGYVGSIQSQFENAHSLQLRGEWNILCCARILPSARIALDDENYQFRFLAGFRPIGPSNGLPERTIDGSFLEIRGGTMFHYFGREDFSVLTFEAGIMARHDLARFGPSLRGAFVEWTLGYGFELYDYHKADFDFGEEGQELLILGFGFGVYLGSRKTGGPKGEIMVFYDHRSDQMTAGVGFESAGGVLGNVGIRGFYDFASRWGLGLDARTGLGTSIELTLRYRP
jgi:hypothetical protein